MINPEGLQQLQKLIQTKVIEVGARAAAVHVKAELSQGGSGEKYDSMPNRSSAPGEYPAKQSGKMAASIKWRRGTWNEAFYGAVSPPQYVFNLEFFPPSMGGRRWLTRTIFDQLMYQKMIKAIEAMVK